jgi:hypothetical protein
MAEKRFSDNVVRTTGDETVYVSHVVRSRSDGRFLVTTWIRR